MVLKDKFLSKSNSYNYYKNGFERLTEKNQNLKEINKDLKTKNKALLDNNESLKIQINQLNNKLNELKTQYNEEINSLNNQYVAVLHNIENNLNLFKDDFSNMERNNRIINNELQYAFVFNDSINNSPWLKSKDFSLINSAANYSFMYSLYRILNDAQPMNILELGMGQTSKLTTQYANYFNDSKLTIIEGDQLWIENFSKNLILGDNVNIIQLDLETFNYDGTENIRFKDIEGAVEDNEFDLIIIDGPQGFIVENGESRELDYSRTNVWQLIPRNLAEDFIIIIDDFNRIGEQNTFNHVKELLNDENITFFTHNSSGMKVQQAIFTEKFRFIEWI